MAVQGPNSTSTPGPSTGVPTQEAEPAAKESKLPTGAEQPKRKMPMKRVSTVTEERSERKCDELSI